LDHLPGSFFGPSTLVELLCHRAQHQGDEMGFRYLTDGERNAVEWTYADVDRKARAIAAYGRAGLSAAPQPQHGADRRDCERCRGDDRAHHI
jgi:hypothetical protein